MTTSSLSHHHVSMTDKNASMTPRKTASSSSRAQLDQTTPSSARRQPLGAVSASRLNREASTGGLLSSGAIRVPNKSSPLVSKKATNNGNNSSTPGGSASRKAATAATGNSGSGHVGYMQATISASGHRSTYFNYCLLCYPYRTYVLVKLLNAGSKGPPHLQCSLVLLGLRVGKRRGETPHQCTRHPLKTR